MRFKTLLLISTTAFIPLHAAQAQVPTGTTAAAPAKRAAAPAPVRPARWFVANDTNRDGKMSKQEFMTIHERYFNETDINKDGSLIPEELKAQRDKKRAERNAARAKRANAAKR